MQNLHGVFSGFNKTQPNEPPLILPSDCYFPLQGPVCLCCERVDTERWQSVRPACYNKEEKGWKNPGAKEEVKARPPPAAPEQPKCSDRLRLWGQRCSLCRVAVPRASLTPKTLAPSALGSSLRAAFCLVGLDSVSGCLKRTCFCF